MVRLPACGTAAPVWWPGRQAVQGGIWNGFVCAHWAVEGGGGGVWMTYQEQGGAPPEEEGEAEHCSACFLMMIPSRRRPQLLASKD